MGKYNNNTTLRPSSIGTSKAPHEIWRGIGCLMFILIPAMSIASASVLIQYGVDNKWPIPYQLLGTAYLPEIFYSTPGLATVFGVISKVPNFYAVATTSLIFMMLLGGLISVVYATMYRAIGPARYGPTDAPPTGKKVKRYKR